MLRDQVVQIGLQDGIGNLCTDVTVDVLRSTQAVLRRESKSEMDVGQVSLLELNNIDPAENLKAQIC